jgi:pilus assembly protein Flp/PilA
MAPIMTPVDILHTTILGRFLADQRGATAIEYGLIAALISVTIIATVFSVGIGIRETLYGNIVNALSQMQ